MTEQRIVVLNGASSSGKTTVARAIRDLLGESCAAVSIDDLYGFVSPRCRNDWSLFLTLTKVLASTTFAFAREGHVVVVDTVFERRECHRALLETLEPFGVVLVRVDCPLGVLVEREQARGNRRPGLAAGQANRIHEGITYNLAIDTSSTTALECAKLIVQTLALDAAPPEMRTLDAPGEAGEAGKALT